MKSSCAYSLVLWLSLLQALLGVILVGVALCECSPPIAPTKLTVRI